jgi:hypothetical protein
MAVAKLLFAVGDMPSLFSSVITLAAGISLMSLAYLVIYNVYFHPLAEYPGPWYAKVTSLSLATISWFKAEPQWLQSTVRRYGSKFSLKQYRLPFHSRTHRIANFPPPGNKPIRIAPSMLLFPRPSSLKDIYRDPRLNNKSGLYGTGILGPAHLFSTLDGDEHRNLRKALGGSAVCSLPSLIVT